MSFLMVEISVSACTWIVSHYKNYGSFDWSWRQNCVYIPSELILKWLLNDYFVMDLYHGISTLYWVREKESDDADCTCEKNDYVDNDS